MRVKEKGQVIRSIKGWAAILRKDWKVNVLKLKLQEITQDLARDISRRWQHLWRDMTVMQGGKIIIDLH